MTPANGSNQSQVIEAEVVEEQGTDPASTELLAPAQAASTTLFRTDDPVQVLERATETANALKDVLKNQGLTTNIRGKEHVNVEGWQTLGAMLGVTPVCVWTRPIEGGWEARVEARTLDGRVIGAAEAECLKAEGGPWGGADFARRSMAQTRATSKALGSVLRFVVTLAGYSGTPAEEMPNGASPPPQAAKAPASGGGLDPERIEGIISGFSALKLNYKAINLLLGACGIDALRANSEKAVRERLTELTSEQADAVDAELEREANNA